MRIGIKFCGGCNPEYERREALRLLEKDFPLDEFVYVNTTAEYDVCVMISGCKEECSRLEHPNPDAKCFKISSIDRYPELKKCLEHFKVSRYKKDPASNENGE